MEQKRASGPPVERLVRPVWILVGGIVAATLGLPMLARFGWLEGAAPFTAGFVGGGAALALVVYLIEQDKEESRVSLLLKDIGATVAGVAVLLTGMSSYGWSFGIPMIALVIVGAVSLGIERWLG